MVRPESSIKPAGESPATVTAGEPCSRPRVAGEILQPERGVESPWIGRGRDGGKQTCRPRIKRTLQPRDIEAERRGGRADHVAAKAKDSVRNPEEDAGHLRGTEESMYGRLDREQERPYPVAHVGRGVIYKPKVK